MKPAALVLAVLLLLPACKEEVVQVPDPVPLTEEAVSYFCQMNVLEHGGPKAQVHLEGQPAPLFFAQVRDVMAYLKGPERDARVLVTYVSDMGAAASWDAPGTDNWIDAGNAYYVVGASVAGGMGAPEVAPFASEADAIAFADAYGGQVVRLAEVSLEAVTGPVEPGAPLETPS